MIDQLQKYYNKMLADRSVLPDRVGFAGLDDRILVFGASELSCLAGDIAERVGCLALIVAAPSLLFSEYLLRRTEAGESFIIPGDTETRTFLHDIPILRKDQYSDDPAGAIAKQLSKRKGIIVEGIGIIAAGALTVEQAYVNWSSVFQSTFVKYLADMLCKDFLDVVERQHFQWFRDHWLQPVTMDGLDFREGPLLKYSELLDEMIVAGRYTVSCGLVDSFFGNISCRLDDSILISQTASSLDELAGLIDRVPFDDSSTEGITASSELAAHRRIYETRNCRTILHGHPRFSVVMSTLCDTREKCGIIDCWKECREKRYICGTPVVSGEIGAGGLAGNVPRVIGETGSVIVYGHGVFSIGDTDFGQAFGRIVNVENCCRNEYFRIFDRQHRIS